MSKNLNFFQNILFKPLRFSVFISLMVLLSFISCLLITEFLKLDSVLDLFYVYPVSLLIPGFPLIITAFLYILILKEYVQQNSEYDIIKENNIKLKNLINATFSFNYDEISHIKTDFKTDEKALKFIENIKVKNAEMDHKLWIHTGLTEFTKLINQQNTYKELTDISLSYICKYTNAGMGAIYFAQTNENGLKLNLISGFALESDQLIRTEFESGEGLVGQCFSDNEIKVIKNVPHTYFKISSSLGDLIPSYTILMPISIKENHFGVIELCFMNEPNQVIIEFLNLVIHPFSQTFYNISVNENFKEKMKDSQTMLINIINEIPMKVFIKKYNGAFYIVNEQVSKFHNMSAEEMIGKSDFDFYDSSDAADWLKVEQTIIDKGEKEEYIHEDSGRILKTTKKPFYLNPIQEKGLLGIQMDITEIMRLKAENEKLHKALREKDKGKA